MRNPGHPPDPEKYPRVDIVYRSGVIVRAIEPKARRWTLNDPSFPPDCEWDIEHFQAAGKG